MSEPSYPGEGGIHSKQANSVFEHFLKLQDPALHSKTYVRSILLHQYTVNALPECITTMLPLLSVNINGLICHEMKSTETVSGPGKSSQQISDLLEDLVDVDFE